MSEWKVFQVDEDTWWRARSAEEAAADYENETGETPQASVFRELTEAELDSTMMNLTDEDEVPTGEKESFRAQLAEQVELYDGKPGMFASTDV